MPRSRNRWLFLLVLVAGIAGFSAVWQADMRDSGSGAPEYGGVYIEGMTGAPARVNPLFAGYSAVDQSLVSLVFAGLTRLDDQGRPFPDLAETWNVSPDGLTYTFTLRNGLVWQDGAPLTADDVLFTYELLRTPSLKVSPALPQALLSARFLRGDGRTFRIELDQPFAPLPAYLTTGLLPVHLLRTIGVDAIATAPFNQKPVGAGPYRLTELTGDRAVLEPNGAYHAGQPYIARLELRFFADDQEVFTALRARQLDGAYFTSGLGENDLVALRQDAALRLRTLSTSEVTFVYLNLNRELFQDRRVRQALLYALDRDRIAALVYGDMAQKADSPIAPGVWSEAGFLSRYRTDRRAANLLLDEAGWRLTSDNVRVRAGVRLEFTLTTNLDVIHRLVAEELASQWKDVGVQVRVQPRGSTEIVRDILGPRSFDALLFEQASTADPDPYMYWHSAEATITGGNLASFRNDSVDRLLSAARAAVQYLQREELYRQFQEQFAQEVPSIPLYSATALYAQRGVKDSRPGLITQPGDRFWQVYQWHVKVK